MVPIRANVGVPGFEARPSWLVPGGRFVPLPAAVRPEYAVCLHGANHRRVIVEGANHRRVIVTGRRKALEC